MQRKTILILSSLAIASSLYAGDNAQATLGDIKEAVYKLIVNSKKTDSKIEKLHIGLESKQDKESMYISSFVDKNKEILEKISN